MKLPFRDRIHAGRQLARQLTGYSNRSDTIVLALPRGGVPVGFEVAQALNAPLDVFLVRKLGVPGHEELAMGAIASGGIRVLNQEVVESLKMPGAVIDRVAASEQRELERRERAYRGGRPGPDVRGKTVILVDDGLATGSTMHAAVAAIRQEQPARIIVAVPTAPPDTCEALRKEVDEVVCAATPEPFHAVGLWYEDFSETTDEEIRTLLERAGSRPARRASTPKEDSMQTCKDVMTKQVSCCLPGDTVQKVAQLMKTEDVGSVPIIDNQQSKKLQGVVTDRDIVLKVVVEGRDPKNTKVEGIMTRQVVTCGADDSVEDALDAMSRHQIRRVPVVDADRRVIGIISQADVATRVREHAKTGAVVTEISKRKAA